MKTMIILAPGLEECEALMTYDLLYRAGIEVELIGLRNDILSSHKVEIHTSKTLQDVDPNDYEALILPGGMPGTKNLEEDPLVQAFLDHFYSRGKLLCAICAAPSIFLHRGWLKDGEFTCFPGFESGLGSTKDKVTVHENFITSRGLGTVSEFACAIIERLKDRETAEEVLRKIQA